MTEQLREQTGGGSEVKGPAAVDLVEVTKRFGEVVAVEGVSLSIPENQFFALLGPSGCGKTTTLRMIGGFEEPTSGTIKLHGEDVTGRKPYRRPVNTVFQSYALFPHMTIGDNVAFGLKRTNVPKDEIARRVTETLDLVQLTGMTDRRPSQLSGGQQQRVALARALINHPRVLLLDEPLGALDLKLRKEMQIELKRIQHDVGITFLHVTHDQEEAMTMADTIAVMNAGRIERLGAPTDIYDDPRTEFVASFLGASNLMQGRVVDRARGAVVVGDTVRVHVPPHLLTDGRTAVKLGVRPEKMRIRPEGEPSVPTNVVRGVVADVSFVGVSTQYLVDGETGQQFVVVVQNLEPGGFRPGDRVDLSWTPEHSFTVS